MRTSLHLSNLDASLSTLDSQTRLLLAGLGKVLKAMPLCIWKNKSAKQKDKSVLQSMHNAYLRVVLDSLNWTVEPLIAPGTGSQRKADFSAEATGGRVLVEAEFGNVSRFDVAINKFREAYLRGTLKVGVFIVATGTLAKMTDSGLATFQGACHTLNTWPKGMVDFPLIVVGIEPDEQTQVFNFQSSLVPSASKLSGNGDHSNLTYVAHQMALGVPVENIALPHTEEACRFAFDLSRRLNAPKSRWTETYDESLEYAHKGAALTAVCPITGEILHMRAAAPLLARLMAFLRPRRRLLAG